MEETARDVVQDAEDNTVTVRLAFPTETFEQMEKVCNLHKISLSTTYKWFARRLSEEKRLPTFGDPEI